MARIKLPKRIQRSRKKGSRQPKRTKYVGRPTKWGNRFRGRRALELYRFWLIGMLESGELDLCELAGYDYLSCWCKPSQACHVDVILELMQGLECPDRKGRKGR